MSEIPQRLRDAGTGMVAMVQPLQPRFAARLTSAAGLLGVEQDANGVTRLPPYLGDDPRPGACPVETPPGFSQRWSTTIVEDTSRDDVLWRKPADLLAGWQSGDELLDAPVLAALGQSVKGVPVANGVWTVPLRTATLPPATHTNAYVVGLGANVVVDPGTADSEELDRLCLFLDTWCVDNAPIQAVFLTHHHADHVTGASVLSERLGVPIWGHRETAPRVSFEMGRVFEDGEALGQWKTIFTPGHAPGHLCLWHAERQLLVAGDMVASVGTIVIDPPDGDMSEYLDSLRRLRNLNPRILYPAHGEPLLNPAQRLEGYVAHRLWRETQIVQALSSDPESLAVITARAYGDVPSAIHWLAQRQALAHLNRLVDVGRALQANDAWRQSSVI